MRFIVFLNRHPKIQKEQVRTWDNATRFANHKGEMTHPNFIRYCQIDSKDVSLMGDVIYNEESKKWIFDPQRPVIFLKKDKKMQKILRTLVLDTINQKYASNSAAIEQSLLEQEYRRYCQFMRKSKVK